MTWILIISLTLIVLLSVLSLLAIIFPPREEENSLTGEQPVRTGENSFRLDRNWFRRSDSGLWELYVEGKPYERGLAIGKLTSELIYTHERIFIEEIRKLIPSRFYLFFLKILVALMNRRLHRYIGDEYCREIHGVSQSASSEFNYVGPKYQRLLNYHAAHDIGHILVTMNLVGCTAFSAWGKRSADGTIISGRNFDFHIGDAFSGEKIVCFFSPDKGYRFASITWGGMIGTVSGMNEHGLALTVNAAKSEFPNHSATPISIMVREVLQYARNIQEAFDIVQKKSIFVSESIMVSSAEDRQTVIIEKSRTKTVLLKTDNDLLICTNHFQSPELINDTLNSKHMAESPTTQRHARVCELLAKHEQFGVNEFADILRNKKGIHDTDIGMGNETAVDQLLAHHSIIFKPEQRIFWISAGPYPEGMYSAYDLKKIFSPGANTDETKEIREKQLDIASDRFLHSEDHRRFINYKELLAAFTGKKNNATDLEGSVQEFIHSNPEMFTVYSALGDYFLRRKEFSKAIIYFETGLKKVIPNKHEQDHIRKGLEKAKKSFNSKDKK